MTKSFTLFLILFGAFNYATAQSTINKTFYHEYDKVSLVKNSEIEFEELVKQLARLNIKVVSVKSHTDKKGNSNYNNKLSQQRNVFVLQKLQTLLPSSVNYITGYFGEDSLLSLNEGEQDKNRRTEVVIYYATEEGLKEAEVTQLVPYTEDVNEQQFEINLDDTVSITANEGTSIKFPPGAFQNKKKEVAKGKALLLIKEYYKPGDILLSGMHSLSDEGLLQTGGMIKAMIVQGSDTMMEKTQKPVQIKIPDINNFSENMNVFTANHSDTSLWNNTRQSFKRILSSWNWPVSIGKLNDFGVDQKLPFYDWEIGRKWSEEYYPHMPITYWGYKLFQTTKPQTKQISFTIIKTDSVTLTIDLHERFRRRAYKKYNVKEFDTTFVVKYSSAVYESIVTGLNYINCDRFIDAPEVTNFYVRTPGFEGAQLLVYFKNLNAFMPAGYEKDKYHVKKVPPGEDVYLVAIGRKGDDFYYGKQPFTIEKKATATVELEKIKYSDMKQMLGMLGYKK